MPSIETPGETPGESPNESPNESLNASLGWSPFFAEQFDQLIAADPTLADAIPARVVIEYQDRYQLITASETATKTEMAQLNGLLLKQAMDDRLRRPAVGDWVAMRPGSGGAMGTIVHLFERRTRFVRQLAGRRTGAQILAANIDAVFVVTSCNRDFNPRRIERYLATVGDSGARAVIVVNKLDLCDDPSSYLETLEEVAPGVPVAAVSALEHQGLAALRSHIAAGETVALVGSSGVGKSTLINWLRGADVQEVGDIRAGDAKGRHTTTHRELIVMPDGGILVDTPGMRELQIWSAREGVRETFADVEALTEQCRFRDCAHNSEPGCALQDAVRSGAVDSERVASYLKLKDELASAEQRQEQSAVIVERRKWKRIAKANRVRKRFDGR